MTIPDTPSTRLGHVPIQDEIVHRSVWDIEPASENDRLYRPIDHDDPEFLALVDQVRVNGITDPLIVTRDDFICSGHRKTAKGVIETYSMIDTKTMKLVTVTLSGPRLATSGKAKKPKR